MSKVSFVWNWNEAEKYFPFWKDGLWAAMQIVGQKHEVEWVFGETAMPSPDTNYILVWSSSHNESLNRLWPLKQPKGLFLTASPVNVENLEKFNVVFAESPYIFRELTEFNPVKTKVVHAFGTNTKLFKPMETEKYYKNFYPATFSPWKRQSIFAAMSTLGNNLALGTIQPDGVEQYQSCIEKGIWTIVGYMPPEQIAMFYSQSERCLITAWHGSERTVLEALACGIPVRLMADNQKSVSLLPKEATEKRADGIVFIDASQRDYILNNYSEEVYASKILEAINEV